MASLIPEYTFEDIVKVYKLGRLDELQTGEIIEDGRYIGTFTNGNNEPTGYQRGQAEFEGQISNDIGGKTLQEILGETEFKCEDCERVCASAFGLQSHMRSHKGIVHVAVEGEKVNV